jgi:hypothetical protein
VAYGFCKEFIEWIKKTLEKIEQIIVIGNMESDSFEAETGVRQGCPLSSLLFEIYIDPLLRYLEQEIQGIEIGGTQQKIEGFVDDLTTFTETDMDYLRALHCITKYCDLFKLELNKEKCEVLCLSEEEPQFIGGIERKDEIKVLGIQWRKTWKETEKVNWANTLQKLQSALAYGYGRAFTIFQKAQYVNTYCCPVIWYFASVSNPTKGIQKKIKSMIYQFVWYGKPPPKLKLTDMFLLKSQGGLQIINTEAKIKELYLKKQTL